MEGDYQAVAIGMSILAAVEVALFPLWWAIMVHIVDESINLLCGKSRIYQFAWRHVYMGLAAGGVFYLMFMCVPTEYHHHFVHLGADSMKLGGEVLYNRVRDVAAHVDYGNSAAFEMAEILRPGFHELLDDKEKMKECLRNETAHDYCPYALVYLPHAQGLRMLSFVDEMRQTFLQTFFKFTMFNQTAFPFGEK